ncbi:MAG: LPS export ABC transporter permease LptG, partial [Gammaproteobacteria bacterium]
FVPVPNDFTMKIIDYYIAKTILSAIGIIVLLLIGLFIFMLFIDQLSNIGYGNYGVWQALFFVLLQVPAQMYSFFPIASLLGSLIGLGILATNSELIIVRAAGFSIAQIIVTVLKTSSVLIVLIVLMGEILVPRLTTFAENYQAAAMSGSKILSSSGSVWLRHQDDFTYIGNVVSEDQLQLISQYQFNQDRQLTEILSAKQAVYRDNQWILQEVTQQHISNTQVDTHQLEQMQWDIDLNISFLELIVREPDEMPLSQLYRFIRAEQQANDYKLAFWQRIAQPFATVIMMLLAIPFVFGPLKSATLGSRFLAGASVGFGFHMLDKFFGPVSMVYQLPPIVAAFAPALLFVVIGCLMLRRIN